MMFASDPGGAWQRDPESIWTSPLGPFGPLDNNKANNNKAWAKTRSDVACSCDENNATVARCADCAEDLCDGCVDAHQRVKLTREHQIRRFTSHQPKSCATPPIGAAAALTTLATNSANMLASASTEVDADVMRVFTDAVQKAKADSDVLIRKAKQGITQIDEAKSNVRDMEDRINAKQANLAKEISAITQRYILAVKEREQFLLMRLDKIKEVKLKMLNAQSQNLDVCAGGLRAVSDQLSSVAAEVFEGNSSALVDSVTGRALIEARNKAQENLAEIHSKCGSLNVHEDDSFELIKPDPAMLQALTDVGFVSGSGYGPASLAEGEGLKKGIVNKDCKFIIVVKDQLNEKRRGGNDAVRVVVTAADGRPTRANIFDGQNGTYKVVWTPHAEGEHLVAVTVKDVHIHGSPFKVMVRASRNYNTIGNLLFEFGNEGEQDGQLCRPWGVTCSKEGYILVANRSNNRIEVYTKEGKFHHNFGGSGKLNGQFDRPAGLCCDSMNRVVVADKDNHRVQLFTIDGKYLMGFGERGAELGQFNYPWDVACNSKDQILVSDTRNHRIQLFSPNGEYITKYGLDGNMWKYFDSPRGVCFTANDLAVVTDFNNHRLLLVEPDYQKARFIGKEGTDSGLFTRPNGVAVDGEGHFIVADSRNDRIQIFSPTGHFLKKFGSKGSGKGEFDRPCGVCVSPEGHIIVVDFGNNRVQVF